MDETAPPDTLPIPEYPDYRVGRDGSVWKFRPATSRPPKAAQWLPLKPQVIGGQLHIVVGPKGKRKTYRIASLVLSLFVEPRPIGHNPLHFPDPDPANCHADNLRWAPRGATWAGEDRSKNLPRRPKGSAHHNSGFRPKQVARIRKLYREGWTTYDLADEYKCSPITILNLLKGQTYADVPDPLGPIRIRKRGREGAFNGSAVLTDEEREQAYRWHVIEGLSYPEIARRLEIGTSTAFQVVRKKLKEKGELNASDTHG